jgi:hypothetical protein
MDDSSSGIEQSIIFKNDPFLLAAMSSSKRFGNCRLRGFVNLIDAERELQFSAVCIMTNDDSCFIVYRGTDMTLVGWKENFNMSFCNEVPAQIEALKFLEKMAEKIKGTIRIGGHSKGGNLAIYAASQCREKIQKRITDIYSNDAPGFHKDILNSDGFAKIRDRIQSFVPQSSVVGMLLEHGNDYTVIKSNKSGLKQNELYSWEVTHSDMVYADKVTIGSRIFSKTLKEWVNNLDNKQREQFLETLYTILNASEAKTFFEIEGHWFRAAGRMIKHMTHLDKQSKFFMRKTIAEFIYFARRNIKSALEQKLSAPKL